MKQSVNVCSLVVDDPSVEEWLEPLKPAAPNRVAVNFLTLLNDTQHQPGNLALLHTKHILSANASTPILRHFHPS